MGTAAPRLILLDSVTQVGPAHSGLLIVTGSHGGASVVPYARAVPAWLYVFNDAGVGKDGAGIAALQLLDADGIAAATVAHSSARIGEALDAWRHGVVSHLNEAAVALGLRTEARLAGQLLAVAGTGAALGRGGRTAPSVDLTARNPKRLPPVRTGAYIASMAALTTADVLDALADESRRRILVLLKEHDLCVCELVHALGLPQPTVSRHLMVMRDAGIVEQWKEGRYSFYRVDRRLPAWARQMLDALHDGCAREAPYRDDRRKLTLIAERLPA